jgi:hypothetical protein
VRSAIGDRIEAVLKQHRGEANAITAEEIGERVQLNSRDVRAVIANEFREWCGAGALLCCLPRRGFFFATETEEILRRQRVLLSLALEAKAKVANFHRAMRMAGFGGLVTDRIPETFTNASQPNQAEDRHRRDRREVAPC